MVEVFRPWWEYHFIPFYNLLNSVTLLLGVPWLWGQSFLWPTKIRPRLQRLPFILSEPRRSQHFWRCRRQCPVLTVTTQLLRNDFTPSVLGVTRSSSDLCSSFLVHERRRGSELRKEIEGDDRLGLFLLDWSTLLTILWSGLSRAYITFSNPNFDTLSLNYRQYDRIIGCFILRR